MTETLICSVSDIRRTIGIADDTIENDDVNRMITEGIQRVNKFMNTSILPKKVIETRDADEGSESGIIFLNKEPILNINQVKIAGTSVSPQYIKSYPGAKLLLTDDAEETEWDNDDPQTNVIQYTYGLGEDGDTETTTSAAITAPASSYTVSMTSVSGFKANDWVRIYGMDGYSEVTKISSVDTDSSTITADISYPHENGSTVVIQEVPSVIKRLVEVIVSLMMVARIVGESYTDIVGYGLEGFSVQKGEPYTQWQETFKQLDNERKDILKSIRPMPAIG